MPSAGHADVVVIGGGIAGVASAYALAPDHDVIVIEADEIARGTTGRASGVISMPLEPAPDPVIDHCMGFFEAFDETGIFEYTHHPTVRLYPTDDAADARARQSPPDVTYHTTDELTDRYPGVFGDLSAYAGALEYATTGWLNPRDYAATLRHEAETHGAAFRTRTTAHRIRHANNEVTGVDTTYGTVTADHVVCAAGWATPSLLDGFLQLPLRPFRWNALVFHLPAHDYPTGSDPTRRVYWRPTRAGNLLVGGNEHPVPTPDAPATVDDAFTQLVTTDLTTILPGIEDAPIIREDACVGADMATPDTWPIIDTPTTAPDGLVLACGFHGRGIMFSPCTMQTVRAHITNEQVPFDHTRYDLDRFDTHTPNFPYISHWD